MRLILSSTAFDITFPLMGFNIYRIYVLLERGTFDDMKKASLLKKKFVKVTDMDDYM